MLSQPHSLRERLEKLRADLAGLPTIAGLGFSEASAKTVQENLRQVLSHAAWRAFDLTAANADPEPALEALAREKVIVVIARPQAVPAFVVAQVRSAVEQRASRNPGPARQLIVVLEGVQSLHDVPQSLRDIPYWDFLP